MMSQRFLDFEQRSVRELCDVIERQQIPVRLLQMGDDLRLDGQVAVSVLHPPGDERFAGDNENSLILLIEYAGRRILLTGDLEREGQRRLLQSEPRPIDVMLSPHHGSRAANPPELANWAGPHWVVVGTREARLLPYLRETYGEQAQVVTTGEYGAVTFEIRSDGTINASSGRKSIDAAKTAAVIRETATADEKPGFFKKPGF
jgi:competence protein ComEC